MKVGICDDILADREMVKNWLLENRPEIKSSNIFEFHCGESVLQHLLKSTLDILFLDGKMNGLDGIQTAEKIKEYSKGILIIILSNYTNYAIDGYGVNVFNYILKTDFKRKISMVFDNAIKFAGEKACTTYTVKTTNGILHIKLREILYIESMLRKLRITLVDYKTHECYGKLDAVEDELRSHGFIRTHKSYLVNCFYIRHLESNMVELDDGTKLSISRNRYKRAIDLFTLYVDGELI